MSTYKIGTRGSLLAVTQSTLMKNELERISGEKFELVLIQTQGDQITDKPLWQLEGKDFFTKELDEALLKGDVDCVIHSYKDLGSIRPAGIKLAAVTQRFFAHDILLIPQATISKLANWEGDFIVGTSSPRRIANLTLRLKNYLPYLKDSNTTLRCETLRGNVNTRIKKLRDGQYHAITLALAGLERLALGEKSHAELSELLKGMNYFVLPQSAFPSAASQGALGIEMNENRNDNGKLFSILNKLAHPTTIEEVSRERKTFQSYGGGCHLAVGIHVKKIADKYLHVEAGEVDGVRVEKKWLEGTEALDLTGQKIFVGLPQGERTDVLYDELIEKKTESHKINLNDKHVFVTSRYNLDTLKASYDSCPQGIWAGGTKTAQILASAGIWVNGTSDSLGTVDLIEFKNSKALQIMQPNLSQDFIVLSHHEATSDLGNVFGTYTRQTKSVSAEFEAKLKNITACLWTSIHQYQIYLQHYPFLSQARHFCGLGKTYQEFNKAGIQVTPVANMQEFYELK